MRPRFGLERPVVVAVGLFCKMTLLLLCAACAQAAASETDQKAIQERIAALERRLEEQAREIERLRAEQQQLLERLDLTAGANSPLVAGPASVPVPIGTRSSSSPATAQQQPPQTNEQKKNVAQKPTWAKGDRVVFGGYGSFRFEANNIGGGNFVPGGAAKSFTFRRFVLTTDAGISDRLKFHSELEFERLLELKLERDVSRESGGTRFRQAAGGNTGAELGLEQLWLQYDLGHEQAIRAGIVLPPLGRFNILHDDDYWDLPRRTLVDRDAPVVPKDVAWRELGAGVVGSLGVGSTAKLNYLFYVLNGTRLQFNLEHSLAATRSSGPSRQTLNASLGLEAGAVDGTQNAGAVAWRMALEPTLAGELAVSGYHGRYTPNFISIRKWVNAFGLDGKWRIHQFEVEGEAIYTSFGDLGRVAQAVATSVLQSSAVNGQASAGLENAVSVELGGLARRRSGFWTDFKYHWRPAFLRKSILGRGFEDPQLIPIVRYERVWLRGNLESLDFAGGAVTNLKVSNREQGRLSFGVNYRPAQQVGFQFAYEHNQRHNGEGLIFPRVLVNSSDGFLMGMTFSF